MKDNIFPLFTFADAPAPPALEVVKKNKIPLNEQATFKINNSALYAPCDDAPSEYSWQFGYNSLEKFFKLLGEVVPVSLTKTNEILKQRDDLKCLLESLQSQIKKGMDMLQGIEEMINEILALKGTMKANKDFKTKSKRYTLKTEVADCCITNCTVCSMTCHKPCRAYVMFKWFCSIMENGKCTICPKNAPGKVIQTEIEFSCMNRS